LLREYIDTPTDGLLEKEFVNDRWGLTNILKAADRGLSRIGTKRGAKAILCSNPIDESAN
jgi:hypothetical protein